MFDFFFFGCFPAAELRTLWVFATLFCIAVGKAIAWCGGRYAHRTDTVLTLSRVVLAAVHGSLGLPGWRLSRGFTLLSFSHSSPSLIGLLALSNKVSQSLWLVPGPFKTLSVCHFSQLAPVIVHAVRVSKCRTGTAVRCPVAAVTVLCYCASAGMNIFSVFCSCCQSVFLSVCLDCACYLWLQSKCMRAHVFYLFVYARSYNWGCYWTGLVSNKPYRFCEREAPCLLIEPDPQRERQRQRSKIIIL